MLVAIWRHQIYHTRTHLTLFQFKINTLFQFKIRLCAWIFNTDASNKYTVHNLGNKRMGSFEKKTPFILHFLRFKIYLKRVKKECNQLMISRIHIKTFGLSLLPSKSCWWIYSKRKITMDWYFFLLKGHIDCDIPCVMRSNTNIEYFIKNNKKNYMKCHENCSQVSPINIVFLPWRHSADFKIIIFCVSFEHYGFIKRVRLWHDIF